MRKRVIAFVLASAITFTATCKKNNNLTWELKDAKPAAEDVMTETISKAIITPFKKVHEYASGDAVYLDNQKNVVVRDSSGKKLYEGTLKANPKEGEFIIIEKKSEDELHFHPNGIMTFHNYEKEFERANIK